MKVIGDFNNLSQEMKAMMPKLKAGEVKSFIKVNGVINRDPEDKYRLKSPILYCTEQVPTRERIRDWHTGEFVDVGVPGKWNKTDGVLSTRPFMPGMGEAHFKNTGIFSLSGDKVEDVELYEYLSICSFNEGNPHRDKSVEAIFKEINVAKDSAALIEDTDVLLDALQMAKGMSTAEAKAFGAALLWPTYDALTLKAKVLDYAKQRPALFIKLATDEHTKDKAELKAAIDSDILDFDPLTNSMKMGQTELAKLTIREDSNFIEAFFEFLQGNPKGADILKSIRKQLKQKAATAAA
jgi:hypothetical protein